MSEVLPVAFRHSDSVITYRPAVDVIATDGWRTICEVEAPAALGPPELHQLQCIGNSRRTTSRNGASFEFSFYGSSAKVYGAVRGGNFLVELDGRLENSHTAAADPSAGVLVDVVADSQGEHVVRITLNGDNSQLDFEQVVFDAGIRNDWTKVATDMRPNSPGWSFTSWVYLKHFYHNPDGSETDRFREGVCTGTADGVAEFTFVGNAVYLIGDLIGDHGRYVVSLDDAPATEYNGKANYTVENGLLFFAAGLDPKTIHKVTIRNAEERFLDIIRTVVMYNSGPDSASSTAVSAAPTPPPGTPGLASGQVALIVGGCLASVFAVCTIVLFLLFLRRSRQRPTKENLQEIISSHLFNSNFTSRFGSPRGVHDGDVPATNPWLTIPEVDPSFEPSKTLRIWNMLERPHVPPAYSL